MKLTHDQLEFLSNSRKTFNIRPRKAETTGKTVKSREIIGGAGQKWSSQAVVV